MKKRSRKRSSPSDTLTESELEQKFYNACLEYRLPQFVQQHKFHHIRNWRFDFAWLPQRIAVEIQGKGPGHMSVPGMLSDYEKHNAAMLLGWQIFYFMSEGLTPYQLPNTISIIRAALNVTETNNEPQRGQYGRNDAVNERRRRYKRFNP